MQGRDLERSTSAAWHRAVLGDSLAGDGKGWETGVWLLPVHHCRAGQAACLFPNASTPGRNWDTALSPHWAMKSTEGLLFISHPKPVPVTLVKGKGTVSPAANKATYTAADDSKCISKVNTGQ